MKKINYSRFSSEELLKLKLKNLSLNIRGSIIEKRLSMLFSELGDKGLQFRPHVWISDEWFTPDDTSGFAVPFYLFHPRFIKLEKEEMFEAEGEKKTECLQIMRHETGHAISHAYQLYKLNSWKKVFGDYNKPYPLWYMPDIRSKNFVTHLNAWYAQAHPLEDFAETFAVWLNPDSKWKKFYKNWPALNKLIYLDDLMAGIKERPTFIEPSGEYALVSELNYTIGEHYRRKKKFYSIEWAKSYDLELSKIFTSKKSRSKIHACKFLNKIRPGVRRNISEIIDIPQYTVDQLLRELTRRCVKLNLHMKTNEDVALKRILVMLTAQLVNLTHTGYYRIPL
jgi:hypothetical protein